jgi:hypothetical protein
MTRRPSERPGTATTSGTCALVVVREQPRPGGGSSTVTGARAVPAGRVTMTTRQIAAARRRDAEDRAERTRLEVLVHRLDAVIEACERAHLDDLVDAPTGLVARARAAIAAATAVLTGAGEDLVEAVVLNLAAWARGRVPIADVMDAVWEVQGGVLDLLVPARRELPDAVPEACAEAPSPAAPRPPALPRRPVTSETAATETAALEDAATWAELFRSAQQIWAWPVGSRERERLCDAYTRAVKRGMPRRRVDLAIGRTAPVMRDVLPAAVTYGCAHCGRPCEGQDADGLRACSTEHLLLARITGVGGASHTWRSS